MNTVIERIRANPMFRSAIAAPIAIMIIFSLFNLTAAPDQSRLPAAISLGVVELDEGAPNLPVSLASLLMAGLEGGLPGGVVRFQDEAAAVSGLEAGDVTAILVFPADFTRAVLGDGPASSRLVTTQHLSLAETQFTGSLGRQIEGSLSAAVASIRLAAAMGAFPPPAGVAPSFAPAVQIETELLYAAPHPTALSAPFVMTFATWIASFVGGLMIFLATRGQKGPEALAPVGLIRTAMPVAVTAAASLALATVVAWTTDQWAVLFGIWLFVWLATAAISLLVGGLFSTLGFFAILVVLPAVFYQGALSGTQAPTAAAPDWLSTVADTLPFGELGAGYRSLVVGGPDGSLPILLLLGIAALGIALIWIGTFVFHRRAVESNDGGG